MDNKYDIFLDSNEQPDFKYYTLFGEDREIDVLPNFNTINILVGSNNSGKSRFMRTLMKQQKLQGLKKFKYFEEKLKRFNFLIDILKVKWVGNQYMSMPYEVSLHLQKNDYINLQKHNIEPSQIYYQPISMNFGANKNMFKAIKEIIESKLDQYYYYIDEKSQQKVGLTINETFITQLEEACEINQEVIKMFFTKNFNSNTNLFIPTLRTAHSLFEYSLNLNNKIYKKHQKDIFLETVLKNYELEKFSNNAQYSNDSKLTKSISIFTGLKLYNEIVNARNGSKIERKRFEEFEKFIGQQFFNSEIDIVANFNYDEKHKDKDDNETINIHIGNTSRNLHDLGDGIQALIILMYSIFMAPNDTIVFIDEPELNLHPGMQRLFLDQITNNIKLTEKNLSYVIATHSNHLLDLTIEKDNISIYSFSKNENDKCVIKNVNAGDNELLRELGINNSSVFLANSSIWVEGISDRNYLKAFLHAYYNKNKDKQIPKEDIDFAFLEYAGSNLVHYDFNKEDKNSINAYALNNRIFILADNDEGKEEKHKLLKKIAELNKNNLEHETTGDYREIENLLSVEVWNAVLIEFCNKVQIKDIEEKEALKVKISSQIKKKPLEDFKTEYIGKFLVSLKINELNKVYEGNKTTPKSLKSKYKTLLSKLVLDKAISGELNWEHFSKNKKVESLTENILRFIEKK